jgi:hypothetical protein
MFIVALEEHSMSIDKVATELAKEEEE